jgi:hypothetical protein
VPPHSDASLFLSYATALATFSAAAVALGLLHCLNRRQRIISIVVLGLAMLGIASSLIAIAKHQPASPLLNVLVALGFAATAGYVLFGALSLIFIDLDAAAAAEHQYRLWAHREGGVAAKRLMVTFVLFLGALMALFIATTPTLFKNLVAPKPRYAVYGTCLEGGCGLKQRRGPGPAFKEVDSRDRLLDGTNVIVICQKRGGLLKGFDNRVWDRLANGRYVSDVFVDTPNRHGFSEGIRRCGRAREGTAG